MIQSEHKGMNRVQQIKMLLPSSKPKDFLADLVSEEAKTPTERYIHLIYSHILDNRDALGYPVDSKETPALIISNDLVGKFTSWVMLCHSAKVEPSPELLKEVVRALADSYEDPSCPKGCCGFYHSLPKERLQPLISKFIDS